MTERLFYYITKASIVDPPGIGEPGERLPIASETRRRILQRYYIGVLINMVGALAVGLLVSRSAREHFHAVMTSGEWLLLVLVLFIARMSMSILRILITIEMCEDSKS